MRESDGLSWRQRCAVDVSALPQYEIYGTEHISSVDEMDKPGNIVVIPEGMIQTAEIFKEACLVLWWMSVDNMPFRDNPERLDWIKRIITLHAVQSQYALEYVGRTFPESNVMWLTDYINDKHGQFIMPAESRKDIALYYPNKGYESIKPLIDKAGWIKWIPIKGLPVDKVVLLMQGAKIYVDFGHHPGKDRIPREAAANGLCVITNKKGSAAYHEDVPIPDDYKFEKPAESLEKLDALMHDICDNFPAHQARFEEYRNSIKAEKAKFIGEVRAFAEVCEGIKVVKKSEDCVDLLRRVEEANQAVLEVDETQRNLGKRHHECRICGAEGEFNSYLAREMMQNKRDEFEYFACPKCGCLQIARIPENLGDYYGEGYYSFTLPEDENRQYKNPVTENDKILDVGCGSGAWLVTLADEGYGNLFGCDPFVARDIRQGDRIYIRKCTIHEMEGDGTFDLVHMGDSFEHVTDPMETMRSAAHLIKGKGMIEIRIPTFPNVAFELFGPHWCQLDAPRHIFLHSRASIEYLAERAGLEVTSYIYDSDISQIYRSFFYKHGVPFHEITAELVEKFFTPKQLQTFKDKSDECNRNGYGDHMIVRLRKKKV
jgi:SAM-dependent methyltransferase